MSQARVLGLIGAAAVAALAVAYAQTTVTPAPDNAPVEAAPLEGAMAQVTWGDPKAGQQKAATCAACHGVDGNPSDPQYPRLAGMPERYTAHQLALFKSGERNSGMAAVMKPFADPLSPQDMRDLGAYFALQTPTAGVADDTVIQSGPYAGMKFYEVGQRLYTGGDSARGIPACLACHAPDGSGNPGPAYPALHGQMAAYSQRRLEEYRAGVTDRRDPALFNVMASVAKQLTDEEIGALASYMQGLHARRQDVGDLAAPAAQSAPVAAPAAPSQEPAIQQAAPAQPQEPTDPVQPEQPATPDQG